MAQDLFEGHSYTFQQNSGSLLLLDSTDNSHEQITFREGLIASGSVDIIQSELKIEGDRLYINSLGEEVYPIAIYNYNASSYNSSDRGIWMRVGDEYTAGSSQYNYYMEFQSGNGVTLGRIRAQGHSVEYDEFTGVHKVSLLENDSKTANVIPPISSSEETQYYSIYERGTILSLVKAEIIGNDPQPVEYCVTSSTHQDKRVLGVYMGSDTDQTSELGDYHTSYSIGDGVILVCSQNGNIENGDYITTASGSGGYGCKQNDDILHNYTVAKSLEDVDWSTESKSTKLIACTYHCG
tara:strand:- start:547 stop:1431 length:885 start_codon:yes stop_codon:yes gene_type:complete